MDLRGMERLVTAIQELSLARSLDAVQAIVRTTARELTGADGATFILRDGESSFYVDEDAIAPLWKGRRFPLEACISGWAMVNRSSAVIEDIYADPRVPSDAYRPTFVKSLAMVPIRTADPIGAIGTYWATPRCATDDEVRLLQTLADSTSIAIENVNLYRELEDRVQKRTAELEATNLELEGFAYSISHDLRAPLRAIQGFSQAVIEDAGERLEPSSRKHLDRVIAGTNRMSDLIDALLGLSRISRANILRSRIDLSALAHEIASELRGVVPDRDTTFTIAPGLVASADPELVRTLLSNLLSNAWKFTSKKPGTSIEVGLADGAFFVKDDGAGFDEAFAGKLFAPFQRLHAASEFPGLGIGLATVQRIVRRHGGEVHPSGAKDRGATFRFTLG